MFSVAAMTAEDDVAEDDLNFFTVQKLHFIGEVDRFIIFCVKFFDDSVYRKFF